MSFSKTGFSQKQQIFAVKAKILCITSRGFKHLVGLLVALVCLAPYSVWWLATQADYSLLLTPQVLLSIGYMGIISTTGGFVLWNEGLLYMDASTAGLFMFWQPIVGTFLGWLLLGEPVTLWFWLGALLIVAGVVMAMGRPKKA